MTTLTFEVITKADTKRVTCELTEERATAWSGTEMLPCIRQIATVTVEGAHVGLYFRVRPEHGAVWLSWVDADFTHSSRSLREIARYWAN